MAYQEYVITSLDDIPTLFAQFAQSLQWKVTIGDEPRFQRPDDLTAVNWRIRSDTSDQQSQYLYIDAPDEPDAMSAAIQSPQLGPRTGSNYYVPAPTKLHMLGGFDAEPWLAAIIEYGFNSYRHIYVGYMEKIGNYAGGEVLSGSYFRSYTSTGGTQSPYNYIEQYYHQYLFTWYQYYNRDETRCGGVRIIHPDNPNHYRMFRITSTISQPGRSPDFDVTGVMGGFRDGLNDGYLARANSSFAGTSILVPVNLYAPIQGNWLVPIGRPAGVRMVNMKDIEPGAAITLATDTWRCFPMFRKTDYSDGPPLALPISGSNRTIAEESSYVVGYAYLEAKEDEEEGEE